MEAFFFLKKNFHFSAPLKCHWPIQASSLKSHLPASRILLAIDDRASVNEKTDAPLPCTPHPTAMHAPPVDRQTPVKT